MAAWPEYSDADGNFAIAMPGVPSKTPSILNTVAGTVTGFDYLLKVNDRDNRAAYMMNFGDYPTGTVLALPPDQWLESVYNQVWTPKIGDRLLYKRASTINGSPVIDFGYKSETGTTVMDARVSIVGLRLYQMSAIIPARRQASGDGERYIKSFRLLK